MSRGVLYVVVTGAGAVRRVPGSFLPLVVERGWDVHVLATAQAVESFPEAISQIEEFTGGAVRTGYHTAVGYSLPDPDAVVVAPATYNTIVKTAAGIADTYVLTRLAEQVGRGIPLVVAPYVNVTSAAHPLYQPSLDTLTSWGVRVIHGPGEPHRSGDGSDLVFPWGEILDAAGR